MLRARFETERTRVPCESDDECIATVTIAVAPRPTGQMGIEPERTETCTPATHRGARERVEAAARAFETAGCGVVLPIRSSCGNWGHGQHIRCVEHSCEALY